MEEKDQENIRMKKYLNSLCEEEIELIGRRNVDRDQYRRELDDCLEKVVARKATDQALETQLNQAALDFQIAKAVRQWFPDFSVRGHFLVFKNLGGHGQVS